MASSRSLLRFVLRSTIQPSSRASRAEVHFMDGKQSVRSNADREPGDLDRPDLRVQPGLCLERETGPRNVLRSHTDSNVVVFAHVETDDPAMNERRCQEGSAEGDVVAKGSTPRCGRLEERPSFERHVQ